MDVGPAELIIVLLIALLIFGGSKLPGLARSMGEAASEFRKGIRDSADDEDGRDPTGPAAVASENEPARDLG